MMIRILIKIIFLLSISSFGLGQQLQMDTIKIYFDFNDYMATKEQLANLNSALYALTRESNDVDSVLVVGYADTTGSAIYNSQLARLRSFFICDVIAKKTTLSNVRQEARGELYIHGADNSICRKVEVIFVRTINENDVDSTIEGSASGIVQSDLLEVDTTIVMSDILFEPDRPILTPGSAVRLKRYVQMLSAYPSRLIEVRGHVNYLDSKLKPSDPLYKLSVDRARVVYDLFIENGISARLLQFQGFGNSKLLYENPKSLQEKYLNMRVELIIFKKSDR